MTPLASGLSISMLKTPSPPRESMEACWHLGGLCPQTCWRVCGRPSLPPPLSKAAIQIHRHGFVPTSGNPLILGGCPVKPSHKNLKKKRKQKPQKTNGTTEPPPKAGAPSRGHPPAQGMAWNHGDPLGGRPRGHDAPRAGRKLPKESEQHMDLSAHMYGCILYTSCFLHIYRCIRICESVCACMPNSM